MAVETATNINQLDATLPTGNDLKSEGDNHIRLLKSAIKLTWPNVTATLTASSVEFNYLAGVTSLIQVQINAKAPSASPALTGIPTAPTAVPGTASNQVATTAFVSAQAFSLNLPGQTGNALKFLGTDGASATWQDPIPSLLFTSTGLY